MGQAYIGLKIRRRGEFYTSPGIFDVILEILANMYTALFIFLFNAMITITTFDVEQHREPLFGGGLIKSMYMVIKISVLKRQTMKECSRTRIIGISTRGCAHFDVKYFHGPIGTFRLSRFFSFYRTSPGYRGTLLF